VLPIDWRADASAEILHVEGFFAVTPTLYTIPISHYGERARWALDRSGRAYREVHHLQMFSWVYALGLGGKKTLPVLRTSDGVINDSGAIVRWADPSLLPTDDALERDIADSYGVHTRRLAYSWFFSELERFMPTNDGRAPRYERWMVRAGMPAMKGFLRRYLTVNEQGVAEARAVIATMLDRVAALLADGRPYLSGDRFSAVDLTFATMTAPIIVPPNYGIALPSIDALPASAIDYVKATRAHPAGAFAMKLYSERPPVHAQYE
jgi:glutathione S-transferase